MRKAAIAVGVVVCLFLIVRAIAEPFMIDISDPATYRHDWGGPSLLGVLLVHCGPGVVAAVAIALLLVRRGVTVPIVVGRRPSPFAGANS